jgi:hypothetical protein
VATKTIPADALLTGTCYHDVISALILPSSPIPAKERALWNVVHGRPTLRCHPRIEYGHAWLERGNDVFDPSSGFRGTRVVFYALGRIDYRNNLVYTAEEAKQFCLAYSHSGPWEGPDAAPPTEDGLLVIGSSRTRNRLNKSLRRSLEPTPPSIGDLRTL